MNMDESLHIRTSTGVSLDYELAGLGDRIIAWLLDILILAAYIFVIQYFVINEGDYSTLIIILLYLPVLVYHFVMETFANGQSIGKRVRNIQVVRLDGRQAGIGEYAMRSVMRLLEITLCNGSLAILSIVSTKNAQRLGDLAAGTTVVKLKASHQLADSLLREMPENYEVKIPQAELMTNTDAETINRVLLELKRTRNSSIIMKFAQQARANISQRLNIESELNDLDFLNAISNDYSYLQSQA
ncbi:MAG: RDD family protein [Bacteroidetes bacterium]|nr:RDD family protein [Bacteroidota bacterium]